MTSMTLARIHAPGEVRLDTVTAPEPGPDDVLVEVANCGICGSDLSYAKLGGLPGAASPFAIGHEFTGTVVSIGSNVTCVAPGDRVVVNPDIGDNGIGSAGHSGAFAPLVIYQNATAFPEGILRLPDNMSFELAALVEPLAVGMHAIKQGRLQHGEQVVIFGAGPVGLAAAIAARHQGAGSVVVVDMSEKRLATAQQLGMTPCKADSADVVEAFLRDTHGTVTNNPLLGEQPASDLFVEATGVGAVFQQITETARKGARVVVVGVHFAPVELNMINFLMRELQITSSFAYPDEFPRVLAMLGSGAVDPSPIISHRFPLSAFGQAFAQAQRQDEAVKVMVDCQA